jgi:hypothetical protein
LQKLQDKWEAALVLAEVMPYTHRKCQLLVKKLSLLDGYVI